jgi:hypothetical protein
VPSSSTRSARPTSATSMPAAPARSRSPPTLLEPPARGAADRRGARRLRRHRRTGRRGVHGRRAAQQLLPRRCRRQSQSRPGRVGYLHGGCRAHAALRAQSPHQRRLFRHLARRRDRAAGRRPEQHVEPLLQRPSGPSSEFCQAVNRNPVTGEINDPYTVKILQANTGGLETSGIDFALQYEFEIGWLGRISVGATGPGPTSSPRPRSRRCPTSRTSASARGA